MAGGKTLSHWGSLNMVLGPNGSEKSNLLEDIELIRNTPGMINK
jgi:AAA15 family ATPase/GTPase